jgi:adenosylhomocysteine nucleosidase
MSNDTEKKNAAAGGVLVCFAMKEEAMEFEKIAKRKPGAFILVTGIGQQNADRAVRDFLGTQTPERVLSCGFAGALVADLQIGDVIFETDDARLGEELMGAGTRRVKFHCADRIATTSHEKRELRQTTNADAVEMESGAIRSVCRERQLPFATVRVISDVAGEDLPLDFNRLSKPDRSMDYGKLALALAKSPGKIRALRQLQKNAQLAADRLAAALEKIIWPSPGV